MTIIKTRSQDQQTSLRGGVEEDNPSVSSSITSGKFSFKLGTSTFSFLRKKKQRVKTSTANEETNQLAIATQNRQNIPTSQQKIEEVVNDLANQIIQCLSRGNDLNEAQKDKKLIESSVNIRLLSALEICPNLSAVLELQELTSLDKPNNLKEYLHHTIKQLIALKASFSDSADFAWHAQNFIKADQLALNLLKKVPRFESPLDLRIKLRWALQYHCDLKNEAIKLLEKKEKTDHLKRRGNINLWYLAYAIDKATPFNGHTRLCSDLDEPKETAKTLFDPVKEEVCSFTTQTIEQAEQFVYSDKLSHQYHQKNGQVI